MSTYEPLVSGIMAAYNYERYIAEALDSFLSQDYPADRLELIVIDDGSTDGTPDIAQRYARDSGGRIRYVRQDNGGLAAATTRGFREARGELITILDADDVWVTSRTRLLVAALARNPDAGLAYGDLEVIGSEGQTLAASWFESERQVPFRGRGLGQLMRTNFIMAPSLMVRAQFIDRFCPIPQFAPAQDWYMATRIAQVAQIDVVPAVVARYRKHGTNMSHGRSAPGDVAKLFRRDAAMRRWMLADARADDLTVEDLEGAYTYFLQTLTYVARFEGVPVEAVVEVTDESRERAARERDAGHSALAQADFLDAASHFVCALAADPFDPAARDGLDHTSRRLVVPSPRRRDAAGLQGAADTYQIPSAYIPREAPEYFVDLLEERDGVVAAAGVYTHAADVAARLGARRVIDLGAGAGGKLVALRSRFEIVGLDYGPNVELARRRHPEGVWHEHDLDSAGPLPLSTEQLAGSIVICANVIEQLHHPERLLENLRALLPFVEAIVMSTPDRDQTHGPGDLGPPKARHRVREWNTLEFAALLEAWGFEHGTLSPIPAAGPCGPEQLSLAVLCPDAERVARLENALLAAA